MTRTGTVQTHTWFGFRPRKHTWLFCFSQFIIPPEQSLLFSLVTSSSSSVTEASKKGYATELRTEMCSCWRTSPVAVFKKRFSKTAREIQGVTYKCLALLNSHRLTLYSQDVEAWTLDFFSAFPPTVSQRLFAFPPDLFFSFKMICMQYVTPALRLYQKLLPSANMREQHLREVLLINQQSQITAGANNREEKWNFCFYKPMILSHCCL